MSRSEGFAALPKWIITSGLWAQIKPADRNALMCLSVFADADGRCWPTLDTVAHLAGINRRTAERAIESLTGWGVVVVERGGGRGRPNRYRIPQNPDEFTGVLPAIPRQPDRGNERKTPASPSLNPGIPVHKPRSGATKTPVHRPDQHPKNSPKNTPPTTPEKTAGRGADKSPVESALRSHGVGHVAAAELAAQTDPPITPEIVAAVAAEVRAADGGPGLIVHRLREGELPATRRRSVRDLPPAQLEELRAEARRRDPSLVGVPNGADQMWQAVARLSRDEAAP